MAAKSKPPDAVYPKPYAKNNISYRFDGLTEDQAVKLFSMRHIECLGFSEESKILLGNILIKFAKRGLLSDNIRGRIVAVFQNAPFDEVESVLNSYVDWLNAGKPKGTYYENRRRLYGSEVAKEKLSDMRKCSSATAKMNIDRTILSPTSRKKAAASKKINAAKDAEYNLKRSNLRAEYYTSRGYSKEEADILVEDAKRNFVLGLNWFVNRYGVEDGTFRYKEMIIKRTRTNQQRLRENCHNRSCGYSKASQVVFDVIKDHLKNKWGLTDDAIRYATNGGEHPLYSADGKAYYLDFCLQSHGIVIEYNGIAWHPRADIIWRPIFGRHELDTIESDKRKDDLIRSRFPHYLVVWDDKIDYAEILNFIDESMISCITKRAI